MTDEKGQSAEAPDEGKAEQTPQGDVGTLEQQQRELPEKFKGKSVEDVAESYQQLESELGRLRDEVGKKDKEIDAFRMYYQYGQQQQSAQPQQQAPQEQPAADAGEIDFFDKPAESFDRLYRQRRQQERIQERYERAYHGYETAKFQAKQQFPHLFDGVDEAQIDQLIVGGVRSGTVAPEVMSNPNGIAMTAWQLKGQQLGFSVPTSAPNPMGSSQPETPSPVRQSADNDVVQVSPWGLEAAQKLGISEERAREAWRKAQEEQERRK